METCRGPPYLAVWALLFQYVTASCPGVMTSAGCFVIQLTYKSQNEAQEECTKLGGAGTGMLACPADGARDSALRAALLTYHESLVTDLQLYDAEQFWVGGVETTDGQDGLADRPYLPVWRSLSDMSLVSHQGCFSDYDLNDLQLDYPVALTFPAEPSDCILQCQLLGFPYAGLQSNHNANDYLTFKCSCGRKYGKYGYGNPKDCVFRCGVENFRCGGNYVKDVYATTGSYVNWASGQPNAGAIDSNYQPCGALEGRNNWKMGDEECSNQHLYVCQLDNGKCTDTGRYQRINATCLYYEIDRRQTWFNARLKCKVMGGDLVTIASEDEWKKIASKLSELGLPAIKHQAPFMWIGLIGKVWSWIDGSEFLYTNWDGFQPDRIEENCMIYWYRPLTTNTGRYVWRDEACSKRLPFLCQLGTEETTTTGFITVALNITTAETTAAETTISVLPPASAAPKSGATTSLDNLTTTEIVLLVLLVILVLVVLIMAIIYFCYYKKMRSRAVVYPEKLTADVRNKGVVPVGDYYGNYSDSVYVNDVFGYDGNSNSVETASNPASPREKDGEEANDYLSLSNACFPDQVPWSELDANNSSSYESEDTGNRPAMPRIVID